jgi:hypothetical protein
LGKMITANINNGLPFQRLFIVENDRYIAIDASQSMVNTSFCVLAFIVLLLWTTTYFKLKEKEV